MVTLREISEDPKKREGMMVLLTVRVLGWKYCDNPRTYMKTRSDVTLSDDTTCIYSDPIPMDYWDKRVELSAFVEHEDGKVRLTNIKIIRVLDYEY